VGIGFSSNSYSNEEQKKEILKKEMKNYFSPEFLNRIDDTIVFNSLNEDSIKQIVNIELTKLIKRLGELKLVFKFDDKLVSHIAKVGFDDTYGARPIKRAIQDQVEDLVSEEVLNGNVIEGKQYSLSVKSEKVFIK
jgi:ATP-dependent Clp protease ATP-binding subunit ClpC